MAINLALRIFLFFIITVTFQSSLYAIDIKELVKTIKERRPPSLVELEWLERLQDQDMLLALCIQGGLPSQSCQSSKPFTAGKLLCILAGRGLAQCRTDKDLGIGFGLCMAAGRNRNDCLSSGKQSLGYGLCMAAGRHLSDCQKQFDMPTAVGVCLAGGASTNDCRRLKSP